MLIRELLVPVISL